MDLAHEIAKRKTFAIISHPDPERRRLMPARIDAGLRNRHEPVDLSLASLIISPRAREGALSFRRIRHSLIPIDQKL
jgi:hypothetical protein